MSGILGAGFGPKTGTLFIIFGVMFWTTFWTTFGAVLGAIFVSLLVSKWSQEGDPFLERLLVAIWTHFGRLLGCLEGLLGCQVFQKYCKNKYKAALFKIASLRYHSSLGWLLEAMLAQSSFWRGFGAQNGAQKPYKIGTKTGPKFDRFLD